MQRYCFNLNLQVEKVNKFNFIQKIFMIKTMRRERDSNPRYSYPYVSLANWWFQPLTHPSGCSKNVRAKVANSLYPPKQKTKKYAFFYKRIKVSSRLRQKTNKINQKLCCFSKRFLCNTNHTVAAINGKTMNH